MTAPITLVATAAVASRVNTRDSGGTSSGHWGRPRGAGAGAASAAGAAATLAGADFALAAGAEPVLTQRFRVFFGTWRWDRDTDGRRSLWLRR